MKFDINKYFIITWIILSILSFTTSFFIPIIPAAINIIFGSINIATIIFWLACAYINKKNKLK